MPRIAWASLNAGAASLADGGERADASPLLTDRSMRAGREAIPATEAAVRNEDQVRLGAASFRIVTPPASKGTTLEEDGCSNPRAVMHRVVPDIKYATERVRGGLGYG